MTAAGPARLGAEDRASLRALQRGRDWIWLTGNHDPEPADSIGGAFHDSFALGAITFRHEPTGAANEIAGHLHPVARMSHRGRAVRRRCFAADDTRMVMPAFGAFTGGLNMRHAAFCRSVRHAGLHRPHAGRAPALCLAAKRCLPDESVSRRSGNRFAVRKRDKTKKWTRSPFPWKR